MNYGLYLRKSTDTEDKQVHSLEDQRSVLTDLAKNLGLSVVKEYQEARSAKNPGRPEFNRMMNDIQAGEIDGILTWKLDRLARNMVDGGLIMHSLQNKVIKEIRTHNTVYLPKDNGMLMNVELGMANQYVRDLSENVKRGNTEKLKRGEWPNKAPFGYLNDKATKTLKLDPKQAPYVKEMFELYSTALYSYKEIQDILFAKGLRNDSGNKVYKATIQRVISNTFYYGVMTRGENQYLGNHPTIISKELYDKCQEISESKRRPRAKTKGFTLSGLMKCSECGCAITAEIKKSKYVYYHCTNGKGICTQKSFYVNEEKLHEQLEEEFSSIYIDQELTELVYRAKLEEMAHSGEFDSHILETTKQELENVSLRISRLLDAYLSGTVSKSTYELKNKELESQKISLQVQIRDLENNTRTELETIERTRKLFLSAGSLSERYKQAENPEKRVIAFEALSNCMLDKRKIANFSYRSPYSVLASLPKSYDFEFMLPD